MNKLELAERFEQRALSMLPVDPPAIDAEGRLLIYTENVAHIAHCFTIAAALRAREGGKS